MTKQAENEVVQAEEQSVEAVGTPSFAFTQSAIAYDKTASQAMGALSTGMGYKPDTAATATVNTTYIGGAAEVIGFYDPTP